MVIAVHFGLDLTHSELGLAMKYRTRALLLLLVFSPAPLIACLWDSDTLEEERRQFPSVLELITGKFLRHSKAFYEWRIEDRKKRLASEPKNVALYDDLAVAYEKTGQTDLAIETILRKEEIEPGLYETYANLGTFYIHAGRLEEGLKEIEKAIEINPDAHFGREVYQKLLVEYVLSKKADGKLELPMSSNTEGYGVYGFGSYVMEATRREGRWTDDEFRDAGEKATKGILGMMRFGNYDSPVLLEALSDLLMMRSDDAQVKRLATRALLQASYVSTDPKEKAAYRLNAEHALSMQTRSRNSSSDAISLAEVKSAFLLELDEGTAWFERVVAQEESWIADGLNPASEYDRRYPEHPSQSVRETVLDRVERLIPPVPPAVGLALAGLAALFVANRVKAARRRSRAASDKEASLS
jgi:tetratricopeptide (TPR) repeat protein